MTELRHIKLGEGIPLKNECITNITFENSTHFYNFLIQLQFAFNGNNEYIEVIRKDKVLNLSSNALFISDIISFDINSRKIKADLIKGINKNIDEDFEKQVNKISDQLKAVINEFLTMYVNITFRDELEIADYIKMVEVSVDDNKETLIERIMIWIQTFLELYRINLYFFVNLFDYLSIEEIESLKTFCMQEKIAIISISRAKNHAEFNNISEYIIDNDTCIIIKNRP